MARPGKDPSRGRATPKGTQPRGARTPAPSGRYTPPIPREQKVSPRWVPVLMFTCLGLGVAVIIVNYLRGDDASNVFLLVGLGLITTGFIIATQYH